MKGANTVLQYLFFPLICIHFQAVNFYMIGDTEAGCFDKNEMEFYEALYTQSVTQFDA